ncbi:hypothetical protein BDV96DRAFT_648662 [Lophiotrema nucula]|uniref:Uncharacterized protein n=1 Tax=Lophiotrema nucula TaxID=690887 RepID=A0A6A5Z210_9PLEO|nr:hypothetical protein BDV96DRAFT_648662 [Lophiotrema nucula]
MAIKIIVLVAQRDIISLIQDIFITTYNSFAKHHVYTIIEDFSSSTQCPQYKHTASHRHISNGFLSIMYVNSLAASFGFLAACLLLSILHGYSERLFKILSVCTKYNNEAGLQSSDLFAAGEDVIGETDMFNGCEDRLPPSGYIDNRFGEWVVVDVAIRQSQPV